MTKKSAKRTVKNTKFSNIPSKAEVEKTLHWLKSINFSNDNLLDFTAKLIVSNGMLKNEIETLTHKLREIENVFFLLELPDNSLLAHLQSAKNSAERVKITEIQTLKTNMLKLYEKTGNPAAKAILTATRYNHSARGKKAVEDRHNQPGASRDKKNQVRAMLTSGKYKTKRLCAEAAEKKIHVSYDTAIGYLNKIHNPYKKPVT